MDDSEGPGSRRLRVGRWSQPGGIYLITTTTVGRRPFFGDWQCGREVARVIGREPAAATYCFVVMPDHLHWLLQLQGPASLSRLVGRVKSISARAVNRYRGAQGLVWQNGFHDRAVRREQDVKAIARYVVANPVRAGLVASLRDYPLWDAVWV